MDFSLAYKVTSLAQDYRTYIGTPESKIMVAKLFHLNSPRDRLGQIIQKLTPKMVNFVGTEEFVTSEY
ncbi:hypothetical protein [Nostoc sp. PA-18-2419]|uniref:hypothetical protein n=1 Tax=Nostoc sp. PA-18-2419 TaxID=2575443 RepID=UPI001107A7CE|nr:hypothetical protein [Nostoc sp. PA-18-2419]